MKFLLAIFLATASLAFGQEAPPDSSKAKEIQALVTKAADLISSKGTGAFTQLRSGEFRQGDFYIFVSGMDGPMCSMEVIHKPRVRIIAT
jgi:methyl-accepting chemotaxis protein